MFAVPVTRKMRAVGVLLGGSGRAIRLPASRPLVAALFRPYPTDSASKPSDEPISLPPT